MSTITMMYPDPRYCNIRHFGCKLDMETTAYIAAGFGFLLGIKEQIHLVTYRSIDLVPMIQ